MHNHGKSALALIMTLAMVAMPVASAYTPPSGYGTVVKIADSDFNPLYAALPATPTICSRDIGTLGTVTDDMYYVNIDGAGTVVDTNDIRLTPGESKTAGTLVTAADSDRGQTFNGVACTAFEANVRFLERDGLPGYTKDDEVVWSTDTTLGQGDVRLAIGSPSGQESFTVTAGTVVAAADGDVAAVTDNDGLYPDCTPGPLQGAACGSTAILQGGGSFATRYLDINMNGAFNNGDLLYLAFAPGASPNTGSPSLHDLYLYTTSSSGISATFGGRVTRTGTDHLVEPQTFGTAPLLAYERVLGADSNCDRLWIVFRDYQSAGRVKADDVVLYMPTSSITSCANPPPASTVTAGTPVSSVTTHVQGAVPTGTTALTPLIYYIDVDQDGRFDPPDSSGNGDAVYIDRPAAFGGGATTSVTAGDFRVTPAKIGSTTYAAGTIVGSSDLDVSTYSGFPTNAGAGMTWNLRRIDDDGASQVELKTLTNAKFFDTNSDGFWNPATDEVYITAGTTVAAGDIRVFGAADEGLAAGPTTAVAAGNADIGRTIVAISDVRVTGSDSTFDDGRGEVIVFSRDAILNDEDYIIQRATSSTLALGQIGAACPASICLNEGVRASDKVLLDWCTAPCAPRILSSSLQIAPSTIGTRFATSGTDFVPTLSALPTAAGSLVRYNRGSTTTVGDDIMYLLTNGAALTTQAARQTPFPGKAAGTFVASGDTEELSATTVTSATTFAAAMRIRDLDGIAGYSLGDGVYVDLPADVGGTTVGSLSQYDIRLNDITGTSLKAGTFVNFGDADLTAGTAFVAGVWTLGFYDDNHNGLVDDGDTIYALPPGAAAAAGSQPPLGAIRLTGSGGATDGTAPPSGGSSTSGSSTSSSTSSSSSGTTTSSTSSSGDTSTSSSTSSSGDTSTSSSSGDTMDTVYTDDDVAAANMALAASLTVTRSGGENTLMWSAQTGAAGYDIWASDSPFLVIATVDGDQTEYVHADGKASTEYIVTAHFEQPDGTVIGTTSDLDANERPALPGVSDVEPQKAPSGEASPGAGLLLILAALGVALLARRK